MPVRMTDPLMVLRKNDVFRCLPARSLSALAATARIERYRHRTLLVPRNEMPEHLRFVAEGAVELTFTTEEGHVATLPSILPEEWATWLGCFHREPLTHDMWSVSSSVLVAFPVSAVRKAVSLHPEALLKIIELIGQRTRALIQWTLGASLSPPEQRLARLILAASKGGGSRSDAQIKITHERLGHLGLGSRQRVARLLRALAAREMIEMRYGTIIITSRRRLKEFAVQ